MAFYAGGFSPEIDLWSCRRLYSGRWPFSYEEMAPYYTKAEHEIVWQGI
jgi:choline dehydrogenase-like flavoprotein